MGLLRVLYSFLLVSQACAAVPLELTDADLAGEGSMSLLQLQVHGSVDGQASLHASQAIAAAAARTRGPIAPGPLVIAEMLPKPKSYLGYRETGGIECGLHHKEDLYKPIPQVLREHPGVDGFCYFEAHAPWMAYHNRTTDYVAGGHAAVLGMRNPLMCPFFPGEGKGPLLTHGYVGVTLKSHTDCIHQMGDDIYCHALGWLRNQRLDASIMENATAWEELAEEECSRMMQTYNFTEEEATVGRHLDDQGYIWSGPRATARNLNLHAYHKCALGITHAADEMAYCMSLSCLLPPGDVVGHGPWCK